MHAKRVRAMAARADADADHVAKLHTEYYLTRIMREANVENAKETLDLILKILGENKRDTDTIALIFARLLALAAMVQKPEYRCGWMQAICVIAGSFSEDMEAKNAAKAAAADAAATAPAPHVE